MSADSLPEYVVLSTYTLGWRLHLCATRRGGECLETKTVGCAGSNMLLRLVQGTDTATLYMFEEGGHGEIIVELMGRKALDNLAKAQGPITLEFIQQAVTFERE